MSTDTKALTVRPTALTFADTMSLAEAFARSGFFQDANDAAKAIVKIQAGQELGISPVAAMTGIYLVKGHVTLSANILASLVKRHPLYNYKILALNTDECKVEFFENGDSIGTSEFSMEDAKTAGIAGGQNWRNYPRNMLFARAMSNGVKWYCPDVMGGAPVYTPDELGQTVTSEGEISVWASGEQLDVLRERIQELFPDATFTNDGHYNYLLKKNGYPKLQEMTSERVEEILEQLQHEGPVDDPKEMETDESHIEDELDRYVDEVITDVSASPVGKQKMGKDPAILIPPTEWADFWQRAVSDLKFSHKNHALNAFKNIFPHYDNDNMPDIADAWKLMLKHQEEKGRL